MNKESMKSCLENIALDSIEEVFAGKMKTHPEIEADMRNLISTIELIREANTTYNEVMDYISNMKVIVDGPADTCADSNVVSKLHDELKNNGIPNDFRPVYVQLNNTLKRMCEHETHLVLVMIKVRAYLSGVESMFCYTQFYSALQLLNSIKSMLDNY